jgi:hypothetical protein
MQRNNRKLPRVLGSFNDELGGLLMSIVILGGL